MNKDIIYLLRIENESTAHYIYIKHIERLLNLHHQMDDKDKRFCPICNGKIKLCEYSQHISKCYKFACEGSLLSLPKPGSIMKVNILKHKLERPYIEYADMEST